MIESTTRILATALFFGVVPVVRAQDAPVVPPPSTSPTVIPPGVVSDDPKTSEDEPPPSLDDLLEIEESGTGDDDAPIAESDRRALDAVLAEEKPTEAFRAALADMLVSSDLLEARSDSGLGTQRIQQRIVDRLQALIESAARQQQPQPQPQPGSSQQQQQDPGRRNDQEPQDGGQDGKQNEGDARNDQGDQDGSSVQPPPPEGGELAGPLDGVGIEWGGLPPRMRELITQGTRDRVSEMYRSLTEAYYRRMAEEGGR